MTTRANWSPNATETQNPTPTYATPKMYPGTKTSTTTSKKKSNPSSPTPGSMKPKPKKASKSRLPDTSTNTPHPDHYQKSMPTSTKSSAASAHDSNRSKHEPQTILRI